MFPDAKHIFDVRDGFVVPVVVAASVVQGGHFFLHEVHHQLHAANEIE